VPPHLGWEALLDRALSTTGILSAAPGRPTNTSATRALHLLTPLPSGVVETSQKLGVERGASAQEWRVDGCCD
jgi:hypothetical protein